MNKFFAKFVLIIVALLASISFSGEEVSDNTYNDSIIIKNHVKHFDYGNIVPLTEISIGFQVPVVHRGKILSQMKTMFPHGNNDFYAANYAVGLYFVDVIGFGYEKGFAGVYHVPSDQINERDNISLDYNYSQWFVGGRMKVIKAFSGFNYDVILGYTHGFINTTYTSSDSILNQAITGLAINQRVGLLGSGSTDNISVEFSKKIDKRKRNFFRLSYAFYKVDGYNYRLENSQTIHISFGRVIL